MMLDTPDETLPAAGQTLRPEALVTNESELVSTSELMEISDVISRRICAIESPLGAFGTGILIGPDLVLTNHHVIDKIAEDRPDGCVCRFDYTDERAIGPQGQSLVIPFRASAWLVLKGMSRFQEIDYALIRLAEPVGSLDENADEPGEDGPTRGWITLLAAPPVLKKDSLIYVWQHPARDEKNPSLGLMPLVSSDGLIKEVRKTSFEHNATTYKGSSGGGCFNRKGSLAALHCGSNGMFDSNVAIPLWIIVNHIKDNAAALKAAGFEEIIGRTPPSSADLDWRKSYRKVKHASAEMLDHRVKAASILIDRRTPELRFLSQRQAGLAAQVLVSRTVDNYKNFVERLRRVTLSQPEAGTAARRSLLRGLGSDTHWTPETIGWPDPSASVEEALDLLRSDLPEPDPARGTLIEAMVMIGQANLARDRELLLRLSALWAGDERRQKQLLLLVYYDSGKRGFNAFERRRSAVKALWAGQDGTLGAGKCLDLDDVAFSDMNVWCEDLRAAFELDGSRLFSAVEGSWNEKHGSRDGPKPLPMAQLEELVLPVARRFILPTL